MTNQISNSFVPPPYSVLCGFPSAFEMETMHGLNYFDMISFPSIFDVPSSAGNTLEQNPRGSMGALGRLASGNGTETDNQIYNSGGFQNPNMTPPAAGNGWQPTSVFDVNPFDGMTNDMLNYDIGILTQAGYGNYLM